MSPFPVITELVPHQAPMLALEALTEWSPGRARARLTVRADSMFARDGVVDAVVCLEYMAQTVAACLGQEAYNGGGSVRVGMVIACRQMQLERPALRLGEVLTTEAARIRGTDSLSHFEALVRDADGAVVATSTLTLVHGDAPPG